MLHLPAGQIAAAQARRGRVLHLDAQRSDLDLGGLGPGEVTDEPAGHEADEQENDLGVHEAQAAAASFFAFSLASSIVPTM